jgi:hypothetical protein
MKPTRSFALAALTLILTQTAAAQNRPGHPMGAGADSTMRMRAGPGMMCGASMKIDVPDAAALLRGAALLNLTAAQKLRLQSIERSTASTAAQHHNQMMSVHATLAGSVTNERIDLPAYEAALKQMSGLMVNRHLAEARAASEAYDVLNTQQRNTLEAITAMQPQGRGMSGCMR